MTITRTALQISINNESFTSASDVPVILVAPAAGVALTVVGWSLTCVAAASAAAVQIGSDNGAGATVVKASHYTPVLAATVQPIPWTVSGVRLIIPTALGLSLLGGGGLGTVIHGVVYLEG